MKYIHITALFVAVLFLTITACSPDIEEGEGMLEEISEATEMLPPVPEPDWVDNTITITVGRFETHREMLSKMKESFLVGRTTEYDLTNQNIPLTPTDQQYTVDITVMELKEAGFDAPTTISEVRNRFKELGMRPLTQEEAMEVRLHLPDQPSTATGHTMSAFFCIPPEETRKQLAKAVLAVAHTSDHHELERITGQKDGVLKTMCTFGFELIDGEVEIDPKARDLERAITGAARAYMGNFAEPYPDVDYGGEEAKKIRFAGAVIGSEKRVQK